MKGSDGSSCQRPQSRTWAKWKPCVLKSHSNFCSVPFGKIHVSPGETFSDVDGWVGQPGSASPPFPGVGKVCPTYECTDRMEAEKGADAKAKVYLKMCRSSFGQQHIFFFLILLISERLLFGFCLDGWFGLVEWVLQ